MCLGIYKSYTKDRFKAYISYIMLGNKRSVLENIGKECIVNSHSSHNAVLEFFPHMHSETMKYVNLETKML